MYRQLCRPPCVIIYLLPKPASSRFFSQYFFLAVVALSLFFCSRRFQRPPRGLTLWSERFFDITLRPYYIACDDVPWSRANIPGSQWGGRSFAGKPFATRHPPNLCKTPANCERRLPSVADRLRFSCLTAGYRCRKPCSLPPLSLIAKSLCLLLKASTSGLDCEV